MLKNPVSICMISLGVVIGVFRILFMILSNIICMRFISFLVVVHVLVAFVIANFPFKIGMGYTTDASQIHHGCKPI